MLDYVAKLVGLTVGRINRGSTESEKSCMWLMVCFDYSQMNQLHLVDWRAAVGDQKLALLYILQGYNVTPIIGSIPLTSLKV